MGSNNTGIRGLYHYPTVGNARGAALKTTLLGLNGLQIPGTLRSRKKLGATLAQMIEPTRILTFDLEVHM